MSELSIESSGKEMQRVLGQGGVADLIKEMKRFKEEEWVEVGEDEQLRVSPRVFCLAYECFRGGL